MNKGSLYYFLMAVVIIGISVWLFRIDKGIKKAQEYIAEQGETSPQKRTPTATTSQVEKIISNQKSESKARVQAEKESLEKRLVEEQQRLEWQKQQLDTLRSQTTRQFATSYFSQIREGSSQLRELAVELHGYDGLERDINRRADEVLRDQNSLAQVVRDNLDEGIRAQENLIKQTQEQVVYWQFNNNYTTEQLARLAEAQALLESQRQQLDNLRQQRLAVSSQILTNTQAIQSAKEMELGELSQSRIDLQNEILSVNEELARLQEEQNKQRTSQMSLSTQIIQNQRIYDQQQEKVRGLESSIKQKNEELNLLIR